LITKTNAAKRFSVLRRAVVGLSLINRLLEPIALFKAAIACGSMVLYFLLSMFVALTERNKHRQKDLVCSMIDSVFHLLTAG